MKKNKIITLDNGLKIIAYQDNTKHSMYAELIVNYGAINNHFVIDNKEYHISDGVSHFLEHLIIEHSQYGNMGLYFRNNYVNFNGLTSNKFTRFYIDTVSDFEEHLEKLIHMVNIPSFTEKEIEDTKSAIYEEIRKNEDNNFRKLNQATYQCLFHKMDFVSVGGTIEDIHHLDLNTVKLCYDAFYQPSNQTIAIAGNIDIDKTVQLIEKIYHQLKKPIIDVKLCDNNEPDTVVSKETSIVRDVSKEFVSINYKINVSELTPYQMNQLTFYISYFLDYNFDESSDAYQKLIANHLSIDNIGYSYCFIDKFLIISIDTFTNQVASFVELINTTIHQKLMDFDYFEMKKKKTIISFIMREENLIKMIKPFIDNIISFNYNEIDKIKDIEQFNLDDYHKMIDNLCFDNYCVSKINKK